jgi:hypothetical protein
MTHSITTLSIAMLSATIKNDTQRKRHLMLPVVIMLSVAFKPIMRSVVMLSVVVPAAQCNLHQCDALRTRLKC